jgi:hypothetical protein
VKTLQQEIVETLRKASSTARKYAKQYDEFALSYHEYMDQSIEFENIASKVESARCENCAHWESKDNDLSNFCKFLMCGMYNNDGCWNFEQKEKSK